jgi:hypothetical protein
MSLVLNSSGGGSVTLQEPVTASNRTLTLPDATGSLITESMVLLGTLTTTSGSSQILSGLDLTSYKQLVIAINNVSSTSTSSITLNGAQITGSASAANSSWAGVIVTLSNGLFYGSQGILVTTSGAVWANTVQVPLGGNCAVLNSTTSLTFATSAGTFDSGSILVYGVK